MRTQNRPACASPARRRAFTLIELLIVILIIGVLAALLLRGVYAVFRTGEKARAVNELTQVGLALDAFKNQFGIYPPSRIRLRERSAYRALPGTGGQAPDPFDVHSVQYLKKIWPQIQVAVAPNSGSEVAITSGSPPAQLWMIWCQDEAGETEANRRARAGYGGGGAGTDVYELEGDECLVFFLGGVSFVNRADPTQPIRLNGFSKTPQSPGSVQDASFPDTLGRDGPYFEFLANRLYLRSVVGTDVDPRPAASYDNEWFASGAGIGYLEDPAALANTPRCLPSYRPITGQQQGPPIAYFSAYEGRGYRPDDFNFPNDPPAPSVAPSFQVLWPRITRELAAPFYTTSNGPNPYTASRPAPISTWPPGAPVVAQTGDNGTGLDSTNAIVNPFRPDTYQLIAPGTDGVYGAGGRLGAFTMNSRIGDFDNFSNVAGGSTVGEYNEATRTR